MSDAARNLGWTLLRVCLGLGLMTHGYAKLFGVTATGVMKLVPFTQRVQELGLPLPGAFAWAAAITELVGGALIVLGMFTRFAALATSFTMAVAIYGHVTRGDPFSRYELASLYLAGFLAYLLGGAGPWSVDAILEARRARAASSIFR